MGDRVKSRRTCCSGASDVSRDVSDRDRRLRKYRAGRVGYCAGERCTSDLSTSGGREPEATCESYKRQKICGSLCGTDFEKDVASRVDDWYLCPGATI